MAEVKSSTPKYVLFGKFLSLALIVFERFSSSLIINLVAGFLSICILEQSETYSHMAVLYPELAPSHSESLPISQRLDQPP